MNSSIKTVEASYGTCARPTIGEGGPEPSPGTGRIRTLSNVKRSLRSTRPRRAEPKASGDRDLKRP